MKIRVVTLLILIHILLSFPIQAQTNPHLPGEYLVSFSEGADAPSFLRRFDPAASAEKVSKLLNIWLLRSALPERAVLSWLRQQPEIQAAQFNHILENRTIPNDPLFPQQWHFLNDGASGGVFDADMDAEQAWEITTGGLTPAGDTIVIAVIDGGLDAGHPDLAPNLWHNWAEIPNNAQDDDENGYVDDFRGWNVFAASDAVEGNATSHGTPVSAILGAKGNNNIGVSGVNWTTKVMFVAASGSESAILAAYDYVLQARQKYNDSNGEKGAFVVAVNCSWGIDYGQPAEAPLWCDAFDQLGKAGVLSVAATANLPIDVDLNGDLPTGCPSNYLIGVTSLDRSDQKAAMAAWGKTHVDLGAYGQEVFTAAAENGYGYFAGTSFAAPQVAGAVGLLYSAPCPSLIALAKIDPASAAYWAKSLLLENVTPNPALDEKTSTNGRLNLFKALQTYENQCSSCPSPFALKTEARTDSSVLLRWTSPTNAQSVNVRWRKLGLGQWNTITQVADTFLLTGLSFCKSYEFEMQSVCAGVASAWSQPLIFQTTGCCVAPSLIWLEEIGVDSAIIAWESTSYNDTYRLRYRKASAGTWQHIEANGSFWKTKNLESCTAYQIQVQARCEDWLTSFSPVLSFKTKGCGACNEVDYCSVMGQLATEEWIASLQIGAWSNASGAGGNGYQNFANSSEEPPRLSASSLTPISITPGFSGSETKEYYRVYVDFNQDGDFEDDYELAFDPGFSLEGMATGNIQTPSELTPGITRLRVMMKYTTPNDNPPTACTGFDFGQVEDYCVELRLDSTITSIPFLEQASQLRVYPTPAGDWARLIFPDELAKVVHSLRVLDMTGRTIAVYSALQLGQEPLILDTSLWPVGMYTLQASCAEQCLFGKLIKG